MIPKIIHQIWFNVHELPERYQAYQESWRKHHPGWEYKLWTKDNLPGLTNRHIFDQLKNYGARADVLRYELIYQFGGWYCDMDTQCFRAIDPVLEGKKLALCYESPPPRTDMICNCYLGAEPRHPLFEALVREIPYNAFRQDWPVVGATGPGFLTRIAQQLGVVPDLPYYQFVPFLWNERDKANNLPPGVYAAHYWDMGWRDKDSNPTIS